MFVLGLRRLYQYYRLRRFWAFWLWLKCGRTIVLDRFISVRNLPRTPL